MPAPRPARGSRRTSSNRKADSSASQAGSGDAATAPSPGAAEPLLPADAAPSASSLSRTARGLILAGLMLAGLALRAYLAGRGSLWRDEALFLFITRLPSVGEMLDFLRFHESHPPLFYFMMRGWQGVFGTSEAAVLALPVLIGTLQIPALYFVGSRLFSVQTGLIAATLGTLSPPLAEWAAYARPYSLLPLLCLLGVYCLYRGLVTGSLRSWAGYALFNLAMLLTHNWAWMALAGEWAAGVAALAYLYRSRRLSGAAAAAVWTRRVLRFLLAQVVLALAFAVLWLPTLLFQARHAGHAPAEFNLPKALGTFAGATIGGRDPAAIGLSLLVAAVVAALAVAAARQRRDLDNSSVRSGSEANHAGRDRHENAVIVWLLLLGVPLVAFLAALVLSVRSDLLLARCLVTLAPCLLLALSAGIAARLFSPQASGRNTLPALAAVSILLVTYAASNYGLSLETKSNSRDLARQVQAQARSDDLIVISPAWMASGFNYYFRLPNEQICFPEQTRQEATYFNDLAARLKDPEAYRTTLERIAGAHRAGRRVWMIMLREEITDQIPPGDALPPQFSHPGSVAVFRSNQIRHHLIRLYGLPVEGAIPEDRRIAAEVLHAFLFDAGK